MGCSRVWFAAVFSPVRPQAAPVTAGEVPTHHQQEREQERERVYTLELMAASRRPLKALRA